MEKFEISLPKDPEFNSEEIKLLVEDAKSIEELFEIIDDIKMIPGSIQMFTAEKLKSRITDVRHGRETTDWITRTYGFRDAVEKLLPTDRIFIKYGSKKLEKSKN